MKLCDLILKHGYDKKFHYTNRPEGWWFRPEAKVDGCKNVFRGVNSVGRQEAWGQEGDPNWELLVKPKNRRKARENPPPV